MCLQVVGVGAVIIAQSQQSFFINLIIFILKLGSKQQQITTLKN